MILNQLYFQQPEVEIGEWKLPSLSRCEANDIKSGNKKKKSQMK